jgi:hypothetical protein
MRVISLDAEALDRGGLAVGQFDFHTFSRSHFGLVILSAARVPAQPG